MAFEEMAGQRQADRDVSRRRLGAQQEPRQDQQAVAIGLPGSPADGPAAARRDEGKVVRLMDFGAFVAILPGRDGLVHISQISNERVERVSDKLKEGDVVKVKVLEVDRQGRVRLSMKDL